jgi:hypothetical protein
MLMIVDYYSYYYHDHVYLILCVIEHSAICFYHDVTMNININCYHKCCCCHDCCYVCYDDCYTNII